MERRATWLEYPRPGLLGIRLCPGYDRSTAVYDDQTSANCIDPPPGRYVSIAYESIEGPAAARGVGGKCTSFQKADASGLEDGTQYNLVNMEDSLIEELVGYMQGAVVVAVFLRLFKEYQV